MWMRGGAALAGEKGGRLAAREQRRHRKATGTGLKDTVPERPYHSNL